MQTSRGVLPMALVLLWSFLPFLVAEAALTLNSGSSSSGSAVTPVQKVVQMLSDMKAKGVTQLEVEQKTYASYAKFTRAQTTELKEQITDAKASIEKLLAFIEKADSDVAGLAKSIAALDAETAALEGDMKKAAALRTSEHDKFLAEQTDYAESLYALDRAIQMLKSQDYDRPQAMILLQGMSKTVRGMRRVLASLALGEEQPSGAPAVAAYEFQSSNIIDMLEGLKDNFRKELADLEKEEANSAHAYDMELVHLTNTLANLKADREAQAETKAKTASDSASAKAELADTKSTLAETEKFLADATATFKMKTATYESNQSVRKDELAAIDKAIEIISDPNVSGSYAKNVNAELVQTPADNMANRRVTLLQVRSLSHRRLSVDRAATLLQQKAKELQSSKLATFAKDLVKNPFDKVVKMIEDLLTKLKEEAASEADHKAYCDEELAKNKIKREKKTAEVEKLRAQIEAKVASIQDMAKKIATLAEEQATLRKEVAAATEARDKEKAENKVAIKESSEGAEAVKSAIAVLKEFYASAGEALLQKSAKQVPEMEAYKGMQSSQGGVIGMLEVIESDFARVEADTTAAEKEAASEYATFMDDSEKDLKAKHDSEFQLGLKKDEAEFEQEQLEKALASSSSQLDKANAYYAELKPQCVEVHVSFEERAKRRQEEIAALQEAYKILDQKR